MRDVWSEEHGLTGLQRNMIEEVDAKAADVAWKLAVQSEQ